MRVSVKDAGGREFVIDDARLLPYHQALAESEGD